MAAFKTKGANAKLDGAPPSSRAAAANASAVCGPSEAYDPECACCKLLGRKWAPQIVAALLPGPRRFSELHAAIPGLSEKVLGSRLDAFEAEGVVTRRQYPEIPARVEYTLTEAGLALEPVIREMTRWSRRFRIGNEPEPSQ